MAADAACSLLANAGTIIQILIPLAMALFGAKAIGSGAEEEITVFEMSLNMLERLRTFFQMESFSELISMESVWEVVSNWFQEASRLLSLSRHESVQFRLLHQNQGFRGSNDWPTGSTFSTSSALDKGGVMSSSVSARNKMTVPLLGLSTGSNGLQQGCVAALTASYMDLYALAARLRPDAERISW